MLYLLAEWLGFEGALNLVRYQTFRAGATLVTALFIGLIIGTREGFGNGRSLQGSMGQERTRKGLL